MTKSDYLEGMNRIFDNLEKLSVMYWHYKRELETFDFIVELAYDSNHLSKEAYEKVKEVIKKEMKKYE